MTNLERIRKKLSPVRRKKVEARAAQLIAEEMTLQELRRARKLTQVRMAKELGIGQDGACGIVMERWYGKRGSFVVRIKSRRQGDGVCGAAGRRARNNGRSTRARYCEV